MTKQAIFDANDFDAKEFRTALGSFTTGVTVVTTRGADNNDVGLTANSFNSVSLEPPMVLWSLGKAAMSMSHFQNAQYFAVHILAEDQQAMSKRFATRGIDKFDSLELSRGPGEVPLLEHCAARFICKTVYQYEGGDHIIFVGEVIHFEHTVTQPLLFHKGQYGQLAKANQSDSPINTSEFEDTTLAYLLRYCSHKLLGQLKQQLGQYQLSAPQYYFLALVSKSLDHETAADLLRRVAEGDNPPTDDDIEDLIAKGLLQTTDNNIQLTDTGSQLHMKLLAQYKAAESSVLNTLDYEERQTLLIALSKVAASFRE